MNYKSIFAALLLCFFALIIAFGLDQAAMTKAASVRETTLMECENRLLIRAMEAQAMRESWKHEIELLNLEAAIRVQVEEREAELRAGGRITL